MSELEGIKKQWSVFRGILTKLSKFATGLSEDTPVSIEELRIKANRAKEILDKIIELEASMFAIDSKVDSKLDEAEESYYDIMAKLNECIKKQGIVEMSNTGNETTLNTSAMNSGPEVRLAKLQIPTFSGEYTEWQSFFDFLNPFSNAFSSIHSRDSISSVQKFQYLIGLLRGDALSLVRHFKITESNYIEALKKLMQRYDRKRHTINAFIRSFIEQPHVQVANAVNIRKLLDTSDEAIRGLKALGDKAESRDPWLIYLLLQKLDDETRSLWAQQNTDNEFPPISQFFEFLLKRTDALESIKMQPTRSSRSNVGMKSKNCFTTTATNATCTVCKKISHRLIDCDQFKALDVKERRNLIANDNRCFNCLNSGHSVYDCRMRGRCRQCFKKHHTLLHLNPDSNVAALGTEVSHSNLEGSATLNLHTRNDDQIAFKDNKVALRTTMQTVLPTAMVNILDTLGIPRLCRALLDTASQASFVTETLMQKLMLPRTNCRTLIAGIGQANGGKSNGSTTLRLASRFNNEQISTIQAIIIPKITSSLPSFEFDPDSIHNLGNIDLADPNFYKPGNIDMLLGADIIFDLLEDGSMKLDNTNMKAYKTKLGWIIGGRHIADKSDFTQSLAAIVDIDATLQRFWEIEELPHFNKMSKEEEDREAWFKTTTTRAEDGKFVTKIPFKNTQQSLGSTYQQSLSRLLAMERRFKVDPPFRKLYNEFMQEYEDLHHMQPIEINNTMLRQSYILPHHGVFKHSSSTTKLRVVFDASAKSTTGVSLNDNLMVGPNVQSSLFHIIMRFRQHPYVLVGD